MFIDPKPSSMLRATPLIEAEGSVQYVLGTPAHVAGWHTLGGTVPAGVLLRDPITKSIYGQSDGNGSYISWSAPTTSEGSAETDAWSTRPFRNEADAANFLSMTTFGGKWQEIQDCVNVFKTREAWLDWQLSLSMTTTAVSTASWTQRCVDGWASVSPGPLPDTMGIERASSVINPPFVNQACQLRMRAVWALSQIYVISAPGGALEGYDRGWPAALWLDTLNKHAFGNWRNLIEEVTYSPQMGRMLSYHGNRKGAADGSTQPDENYAREIMQLFSIGLWELNADGTRVLDDNGAPIPTYNLNDIRELARVFTGLIFPRRNGAVLSFDGAVTISDYSIWNSMDLLRTNGVTDFVTSMRMGELTARFDNGEKTIFRGKPWQVTIPAGGTVHDGLKIIHDTLFNHPNTGPFLARLLIQRFTKSNPSANYIRRVAAAFADNGMGERGDMKAVWRAILMDRETVYPDHTLAGRVIEPWLGALRISRILETTRTTPGIEAPQNYYYYITSGGLWSVSAYPAAPSIFSFYPPNFSEGLLAEAGAVSPEAALQSPPIVMNIDNYFRSCIIYSSPSVAKGALGTPFTDQGYATSDFSMLGSLLVANAAALMTRINILFCNGKMPQALQDSIRTASVAAQGGDTTQNQYERARFMMAGAICSPFFRVTF